MVQAAGRPAGPSILGAMTTSYNDYKRRATMTTMTYNIIFSYYN